MIPDRKDAVAAPTTTPGARALSTGAAAALAVFAAVALLPSMGAAAATQRRGVVVTGFSRLSSFVGAVTPVASAPAIATTTLPDADEDQAYSETLAATGTVSTWSITSGALPAGLSLNAGTGEISGTPTEAGDFDITVRATGPGGFDEADLTLTVVPAPPVVTTTTLPNATEGAAYSATLAATGAVTAWSITSGALPAGLSLNAGTGEISGTPTATGTVNITVAATNAGGSDDADLTLTVATWYAGLVAALESAAGVTASHAVFVAATTTTKNVGGDPAANGDRIYKLFDLKAGAYDYIEGGADKGGTYRAASVGTRAAMQLDRSNQEWMKTVKNANAATPNLIPAGDHTVIVVGKFSDNNVNSSTMRFNPLIWGSSDMGSAGGASPSLLLRDDATDRIGGYDADGGVLATLNSTQAPYDTPLALSLRNKIGGSGFVSIGAGTAYATTAHNASIPSLAKLFHIGFGADYLSGYFAAVIVLPAALSDAQLDAAIALTAASFGI